MALCAPRACRPSRPWAARAPRLSGPRRGPARRSRTGPPAPRAGMGLPLPFGDAGAASSNGWVVPTTLLAPLKPADAVRRAARGARAGAGARTTWRDAGGAVGADGAGARGGGARAQPRRWRPQCTRPCAAGRPRTRCRALPPRCSRAAPPTDRAAQTPALPHPTAPPNNPPPAPAQPSAEGPLTVYTLRLITSFDRGAALSDPAAGVNVCLIAADGRALLHRVPPVNDPKEALSSMDDICAVRAGGGEKGGRPPAVGPGGGPGGGGRRALQSGEGRTARAGRSTPPCAPLPHPLRPPASLPVPPGRDRRGRRQLRHRRGHAATGLPAREGAHSAAALPGGRARRGARAGSGGTSRVRCLLQEGQGSSGVLRLAAEDTARAAPPGRQVSILAPELGPLAAALVAPEGGSWVLDELNVSSSRTNHIDRFVCRHQLGGRRGEGAAYLTPVPPGAVVYGSGDSARILTKVRRGGGVFGWGGEQGWGGCAGSERPGSALRAAAGEGSRSVAALTGAPASLRPLARPRPRRARPRRSRPPRCAARASMSTQT
jgi:hypothetical protein